MARITIGAKSRGGTNWLSTGDGTREYVFSKICRDFRTAFSEHLLDEDNWQTSSTIDDFVVLKTNLERAKEILQDCSLTDEFTYTMGDSKRLRPENKLIVIEVLGKNRYSPSDYLKWRTRNAFAKIIHNAGHPNGFQLKTNIYLPRKPLDVVLPASDEDVFWLFGSRDFKTSYLEMVPEEYKEARLSPLTSEYF